MKLVKLYFLPWFTPPNPRVQELLRRMKFPPEAESTPHRTSDVRVCPEPSLREDDSF